MPTQDEIDTVKTNLDRIISFNKDILSQATYKFMNAFTLLSQTDNTDLGLQIGLNLLGGGFWAVGSLFGPLGNIPANFLSALVANYGTNTPPNLNNIFSSLLIRFQTTMDQASQDIALLYQDPQANWSKKYSGSFTTPFGTYQASCTLSDLTKITFPVQTDPNYYILVNGVLKAIDQGIWSILLKRFVLTQYIESNPPLWTLPCDPVTEDNSFLPKNKSYYNTWTYHEDKDCYGNLVKYYDREQYNIGTGASTFSDGALNNAACDYMFQNYATAQESPDGLFQRVFVFTSLGIPTANQYINNRSWFSWRRQRTMS